MTVEENIAKLKDARDKTAEVYEDEVTDDIYDNGNLDIMNNAIKDLEEAIKILEKRLPEE